MKSLLLTLLCAVFTTALFAQLPQGFNYQAVLRDADGQALTNQAATFIFTIQVTNPDGTAEPVYRESQSLVSTSVGTVNAVVGTGASSDDFSAIPWASTPASLLVSVVLAGETEVLDFGSQELQSVPYALHSSGDSPWEVNEDGEVTYPGSVRSGSRLGLFDALEGFHVGRNEMTQAAGFSAFNNNPESREMLLLGQGSMSNYVFLGYNNTQFNVSDVFTPLISPGTAVLYTGAPNGLHLLSWRDGIRLYTGNDTQGTTSTFSVSRIGNVGIGTDNAGAKLEVTEGDVYITDANRGIIMTAPNGQCYRTVVGDDGVLTTTPINCPR